MCCFNKLTVWMNMYFHFVKIFERYFLKVPKVWVNENEKLIDI